MTFFLNINNLGSMCASSYSLQLSNATLKSTPFSVCGVLLNPCLPTDTHISSGGGSLLLSHT